MAIRTISDTGGNYNATASWVEGVVPNSNDDVIATATSGQLTINVSSAAKSINLSLYTNVITINSNWTVSGSSTSVILGGTFTQGVNGILELSGNTVNTSQVGTSRVPKLRFSGSTRTLLSDIYAVIFDVNDNVQNVCNGYKVYISGNFGQNATNGTVFNLPTSTTVVTLSANFISGTTEYVLDGTGVITQRISAKVTVLGTYSTNAYGLMATYDSGRGPTPVFNIFSPTLSNFTITLDLNSFSSTNVIEINGATNSAPITQLVLSGLGGLTTVPEIGLYISGSFSTDYLLAYGGFAHYGIWRRTLAVRSGALVVNKLLSLTPFFYKTGPLTEPWSPSLLLNSENIHRINAFGLMGGWTSSTQTSVSTISSLTSSVPCKINLTSKSKSQILNYDFKDVDASYGEQIITINGSVSNCVNVTNIYPTGAVSVLGGAFTFVN